MMESEVVLRIGDVKSKPGDVLVGVLGLDLDLPRKISRKPGDGRAAFLEAFVEVAKSEGEGFEWAGGRK